MNTTPSGFVPDEAREAFLLADVDIGERGIGGRDHMARAFLDTGDLAGRMRDGTAHLPAELAGDLGLFRDESVDRAAEQGGALTQRRSFPCCLRAHGGGERAVDLVRRGERPLDINAAVDRRDGP